MRKWKKMCGGGVPLVLCLVLVVSFGDAVEDNPNDFPLPTGNNISMEGSIGKRVVSVNVKVNVNSTSKYLGGRIQEINKEGLEKNNRVKTSIDGLDKPVNESTINEEKGIPEKGFASRTVPKETTIAEECDTSNSCMDDKSKLIACLRVPGNDSPTLSLLIQNKGTLSHTIGIHAPDFVKVEQSSLLLHAKEEKKVKVSFESGVNNSPILLSAADWRCNLSFWDMISDSMQNSEHSVVPMNAKLSGRASFIYASLAVLMVIGAVLIWIRIRQKHNLENPSFHKLERGLPVSSGGIKEDNLEDGWDNSWGEGWDDEEAPTTPSNPSLSLSSKGLASRRSTKEGWKD